MGPWTMPILSAVLAFAMGAGARQSRAKGYQVRADLSWLLMVFWIFAAGYFTGQTPWALERLPARVLLLGAARGGTLTATLLRGDVRQILPTLEAGRFRCAVTSVPYWEQREYLPADHPEKHLEIGHEATPAAYVQTLVEVFRELRRALADDGTLWINIGDKWANDAKWGGATGGRHAKRHHGATGIGRGKVITGLPPKSLMGLPWLVALALQGDGWTLRSEIIWYKINAFPEGAVADRPHRAHEHVLMLAKSERYVFDRTAAPIDVWPISTEAGDGEHAAPMPSALAGRCILAGSAPGDEVLDPFGGSGTVAKVAKDLGRRATLIDLDERAIEQARQKLDRTYMPPARALEVPGPLFAAREETAAPTPETEGAAVTARGAA